MPRQNDLSVWHSDEPAKVSQRTQRREMVPQDNADKFFINWDLWVEIAHEIEAFNKR